MKLLQPALFLWLGLFCLLSTSAQTRKVPCPALQLIVPPPGITEGEIVTLRATLAGKKGSAQLRYEWTLSAGEIISGQGTSSIQIKTDNLGGDYVTATVEIKGLPASCAVFQTASFPIKAGCPSFRLEAPTTPVPEGQPAILTARLTGSGTQRATYHWMVSAGKIRRGQATGMIEVDTSKLGGVGILAAVELGGLAPTCPAFEIVAVMIEKKNKARLKQRESISY